MQHIAGWSRLWCMATIHLEPLLELAERCAVLTVLRRHPEWTLGHICSLLEQSNARSQLLRELTLGELAVGAPARDRSDDGPLDEKVRAALDEAGVPVGAAYLRARVGGQRWTLQASLRRLVEAGVVERSGSTSGTRYWIAGARKGSRS
jgi:hypothetical protein